MLRIEPIITNEPIPLEDGWYLARVAESRSTSRRTADCARRVSKSGVSYLSVRVAAHIVRPITRHDSRHENVCVTDWVNTRPYRKNGIGQSSVSRLLEALEVDSARLTSIEHRVDVLRTRLQEWPLVMIQTEWQVYSHRERVVVLRRMARFPLLPDRTHCHRVRWDGKEELVAVPRIIEYRSVGAEQRLLKRRYFDLRLVSVPNDAAKPITIPRDVSENALRSTESRTDQE
jgi:hypothetical protein